MVDRLLHLTPFLQRMYRMGPGVLGEVYHGTLTLTLTKPYLTLT